jgi:hypothetical protein
LNGQVTDEEAAAIIATDAGPQTQFVYIESTTALKHLDLKGLKNLLEIIITRNADLLTVTAPNLDVVNTKLQVGDNPMLSSLSLPVLSKIGGSPSSYHYISGNHKLTSLSFPKLTGSPLAGLSISYNNALLSVDFPVLEKFAKLDFFGSSLNSISLPRLSVVTSLNISFSGLVALSLPSLTSGNIEFLNNANLASLSAPLLKAGDVSFIRNPNLSSLSLPVLAKTFLNIQESSSLVNLELPAMVSGKVYLGQSNNLESISFPQLLKAQSIEVVGNNKLISASFPLLDSSGNINIGNTLLYTLTFPRLLTSQNISISSSPNLGIVSFPVLKNSSDIFIYMLANSNFRSLETANNIFISSGSADFTSLRTANTMTINITVADVTFPALTKAFSLLVASQTVSTISLPELKVIEYLTFTNTPNLINLSTPKLDTITQISISGTKVTSLAFPQLKVVKRGIAIISNRELTNITFPMLSGLVTDQTNSNNGLNLSLNKVPSEVINNILAKLVSLNPPIVRVEINLRQQPPAPPTGQGLVDKATLQARNYNVYTD